MEKSLCTDHGSKLLILPSMSEPQEQGKLLSSSEPLPKSTSVESPSVKFIPKNKQGVFAAFEKASLKTQQLVIAILVAVISALAVFAILQIFAQIRLSGSPALSKLTQMSLAALVTGVTVGVSTLILGQITTNQINRSVDALRSQFKAVTQGDLGVQSTVDVSNELGQLATSFNLMTQALNARLNEAQRQVEEQVKEKEELQQKLREISSSLELDYDDDMTIQAEAVIDGDNDQDIRPQGTLLDFLDNLQSWFKVTTSPELLAGSSSLAEIQQRKQDLQYRQVWLQALQEETYRELQVLSLIDQTSEPDRVRETSEG